MAKEDYEKKYSGEYENPNYRKDYSSYNYQDNSKNDLAYDPEEKDEDEGKVGGPLMHPMRSRENDDSIAADSYNVPGNIGISEDEIEAFLLEK